MAFSIGLRRFGRRFSSTVEQHKASYQALFSSTKQEELRNEFDALSAEKKEVIQLTIDHLLDMTPWETKVLTATIQERKADTLPKLSNGTVVDWPVFSRDESPPATGDEWEKLGLGGFPKQFFQDVFSGKMFEGLELAAPSTPDVDENAAEAEKEAYDIVMTEFDPAGKLKIIKELKGMLGLGLLEAKSLVESVLKEPIIIFKRVSKDHEQEAIDKLVGLGAKLEYR